MALASAALALHGMLPPAATGVMLAAILDLLDGHVARRLPNRPEARQAFGAQLDSLADLLNFSVVPAGSVDMTTLFATAIAAGQTLTGVPTDLPWGEIDRPEDLQLYERLYPAL